MSGRKILECVVGTVSLVLATLAAIMSSPVLGLVSLVTGAVGFGMLIATA